MTEFECIFPGTGETFSLRQSPSVLPPDNATLRLGEYGAQHVAFAQTIVAPLFSDIAKLPDATPQPAKIVDLDSGTGVLAIAAAKKILEYGAEIETIVAIDKDENAADDTAHNIAAHIGSLRKDIEIDVRQADWNDAATWESIADADLILSNPPYIATDGDLSMRPGFEHVDPTAIYLPTGTEVFDMYGMLVSQSMTRLRPFGALLFRLPKYDPVHNDSWPMDLSNMSVVNAALTRLQASGYESNIRSGRYDPFLRSVQKIGNDTFRHLHMLMANVLPKTYPFMDMLSDPACVHYANGNGVLGKSEYKYLLGLAGYPKISGGGWMIVDRMLNYNYPVNDPRYINPGF